MIYTFLRDNWKKNHSCDFIGDDWLQGAVCEPGELYNYNEFYKGILHGAFVSCDKNSIFCVVDIIRSVPLFYSYKDGDLFVGDDVYYLAKKMGINEVDEDKCKELCEVGYVTGNHTLLKNIKALNSGECLFYDDASKELKIKEYYKFEISEKNNVNNNDLEELDKLHIEVFSDLIKSLDNRQVVIPLSGGHDSRLILNMLSRLNYKNVICFTYGKKNNMEAKVSLKVAKEYNASWYFVDYDESYLKSNVKSQSFYDYLLYACNGVSLPHIQDYFAVKYLKERKVIDDDAIFIPGHAYDFLQGSHISSNLMKVTEKKALYKEIFKKHYIISKSNYKIRKRNIEKYFKHKDIRDYVLAYHYWEWKERQSKYIANSVRVYDYFGYDYRLPFWDTRLVEYWNKVALNNKLNRNLYYSYANKYVSKIESSNDRNFLFLRKAMPQSLRRFIYRIRELHKNSQGFYILFGILDKIKYVFCGYDISYFIAKKTNRTVLKKMGV